MQDARFPLVRRITTTLKALSVSSFGNVNEQIHYISYSIVHGCILDILLLIVLSTHREWVECAKFTLFSIFETNHDHFRFR